MPTDALCRMSGFVAARREPPRRGSAGSTPERRRHPRPVDEPAGLQGFLPRLGVRRKLTLALRVPETLPASPCTLPSAAGLQGDRSEASEPARTGGLGALGRAPHQGAQVLAAGKPRDGHKQVGRAVGGRPWPRRRGR